MNKIRSMWAWGADLGRTKLLVIGVAGLLGLGLGAALAVARWGAGGTGMALCQVIRVVATDAPSRYKAKEMSGRQRLKWGIRLGTQLKQAVSIEGNVR